jgi:hypothetical protein
VPVTVRLAVHVPALHVPIEQLEPSAAFPPVSLQTGDPLPHAVVPTWHSFAVGVQVAPSVQALHTPALQTWSVPQTVPLGSGAMTLSTHCCSPVEHE